MAGKTAGPASGGSAGTRKIPTYIGSISVQRGQCVVTVSPTSITMTRRSLSWSHHASVSCGQRGHFTVDIDAGKQVRTWYSVSMRLFGEIGGATLEGAGSKH